MDVRDDAPHVYVPETRGRTLESLEAELRTRFSRPLS
jgi:hypothetical protein